MTARLQAVIFIKVRADFGGDKAAAGLEVVVPMPREVQRVSCEYEQDVQPIGNQSWDWQEKQHRLVWKHKKVKGGTEWTLRVCYESCMLCITRSTLLHNVTFGSVQVLGLSRCGCQGQLLVTMTPTSSNFWTELLTLTALYVGTCIEYVCLLVQPSQSCHCLYPCWIAYPSPSGFTSNYCVGCRYGPLWKMHSPTQCGRVWAPSI